MRTREPYDQCISYAAYFLNFFFSVCRLNNARASSLFSENVSSERTCAREYRTFSVVCATSDSPGRVGDPRKHDSDGIVFNNVIELFRLRAYTHGRRSAVAGAQLRRDAKTGSRRARSKTRH